ncbi:SGNH/GDSL hydrolase family protein [Pseudooctadecabacter jejudonensis]|uniref:SGNH hydrolase-type esterase domain-containing protein n=1 Tax=Pseudooctadecabacter jejudonensis TaxID=1391910 RepID=A0A1Y5SCW8_9RHOB|nr:SGNH/GDSL hydrolase family protein [Pseudooctadecabacter jejudonensis]SLN34721.1 hypothetical protein PSJ8397_01730 [Pseudooctadecabacter jejudonensis]
MFLRSILTCLSLILPSHGAAQSIIAVGDSILAWNEDASIPAILSRELNRPVENRAVSGAEVSTGFWGGLRGFDIRKQLGADRPDILVMTGGGNDLGEACGCAQTCAQEVEVLITESGGGELGQFLNDVTTDGTHVVFLGYAKPPVGGNEFSGCVPYFETLATRVAQIPNVTFLSVDEVIDPMDISFYDEDRIHPSLKGSATIARLLADTIATVQTTP